MTEDGETPDAGSDRDEDGRGSEADEDESTPAVEPGDDAVEPDRDGESGAADDEPAEAPLPGGEPVEGPDDGEPVEEPDSPRTRFGAGREFDGRRDAESGSERGTEHERETADDAEDESSDDVESGEVGARGRGDAEARREGDAGTARREEGAADEGRAGGDVPQESDVRESDVAATGEAVSPKDRERDVADEATPRSEGPRNEPHGGEGAPGSESEFEGAGEVDGASGSDVSADPDVPEDVRSYDRFQKVDRASYDRVNEFLRDRTYVTAREWAIARLCADFRTATGVEMTKIGENLPHLVPFMTDTYSPQAVNQARSAFEEKVRKSGATFLYGAMSGFFTADELDEIMYEVTEVAKFLLEVEGVELTVDEELDAEDRISAVMREVRQASEELRYDEVACPHCGEAFQPAED